MKKVTLLLFFVLLAAFFAVPLAAQQYTILEVETSMLMGYDLGADEIYNDHRMGINFNLNNAVVTGFMFQNNAQYMILKYAMAEKLGFGILFGTAGAAANPSAGVQISYDLLTNNVQGLVTALRLNLEYVVPDLSSGAVDEGRVGVALGLGFGM